MSGHTVWALYEARLRRVSAYIHEHLDEALDMEKLADIACMSSYHWHRIYRAIYGETLAATVKRLRLHRAASEIVRTILRSAISPGDPAIPISSRSTESSSPSTACRRRDIGEREVTGSSNPTKTERPVPCST
jgi:AraC-like DNA-binding protein